jgi:predicted ester cyclase
MTTERNKAIVRRFYEAFGEEALDAIEEVLSPDLAAYPHSATVPQTREEALNGIRMWYTAFSDSYYTIEEQLAEGDRVATRVSLRAVHSKGEFMGLPPTGKQITVKGISIEWVKDGRIVERRVSYDQVGMLQQLGLIPPSPSAG